MKLRALQITSVLVLTLFLAACSPKSSATSSPQPVNGSGNNPANETTATSASSSSGSTVEVSIANFSFSPDNLTIKVGTTVTWTNQDSAVHTVTSDTGVFDSGSLGQGKSFSYTFTSAGTFTYYCIPHHSRMTGTIVVTE